MTTTTISPRAVALQAIASSTEFIAELREELARPLAETRVEYDMTSRLEKVYVLRFPSTGFCVARRSKMGVGVFHADKMTYEFAADTAWQFSTAAGDRAYVVPYLHALQLEIDRQETAIAIWENWLATHPDE